MKKKINFDLIKDLIISILIVICIALVVSVIFYDKISISKTIPTTEEYMLTDEMQDALNQSYTEDAKEVITTYSIDAADLKKYEKTNQYNKGKKNPFAVESETVDNTIVNGTDIQTGAEGSTSSSGFYEDDGTK